jgi:pimeloyl-ACP methyl ester carboxylesterase
MRHATVLLSALLLAACAPREWLLPKVGLEPPALRDFPKDYRPPVSSETDAPMVGFGGGGGGVHKTPVIFIHGNTVSARFWLPARQYFLQHGYTKDELWALGYGWDNARWLDSNDLSVASVERIVTSVTQYLSRKHGRPIQQVDIIGHSLGVTLVRQWLKQNNAWHRVRAFIGACGANDGVWTAWMDARTQSRVVSFELAPGSPWLTQLARGGEVPGPTRYMTLYDGTGWGDVLFPPGAEHSGALEGAHNVAFNEKHGTHYDHLELPRVPDTMHEMIDFLRGVREPLPGEVPPKLVRTDHSVAADQGEAQVHCASGSAYPTAATEGANRVSFDPATLYTCYAKNPRTQLTSPLARFRRAAPGAARLPTLTVSAEPPAGAYEQPQHVKLSTNDPEAFIVYTTGGGDPTSAAPLYEAPIYVPGPLTLSAVAILPDGRQSAPLRLVYDISLELVEARHTLERQFDPTTEVDYAGKRRKGR